MHKIVLAIVFALVVISCMSCVTPKQWTQSQHADQMLMCKKMCGDGAAKYETFTGDCMCYQQHLQPQHTSMYR